MSFYAHFSHARDESTTALVGAGAAEIFKRLIAHGANFGISVMMALLQDFSDMHKTCKIRTRFKTHARNVHRANCTRDHCHSVCLRPLLCH